VDPSFDDVAWRITRRTTEKLLDGIRVRFSTRNIFSMPEEPEQELGNRPVGIFYRS
jgi:hypothetical protein